MKIAPVAELKAQFSAYLKSSTEGPIVVTRHGKPVAVLLSIEDEDEFREAAARYGYSEAFQEACYEVAREADFREADLVKLDVLVHGQKVDAFSTICHRSVAERRGRALIRRLRKEIPRHLFQIQLQAAIAALEQAEAYKDYTTICPPAPVEVLAEAALEAADALLAAARQQVSATVAQFYRKLSNQEVTLLREQLRDLLARQLYRPVRWVETVGELRRRGARTLVEMGPGRVLSGLNRRIDKQIESLAVYDPDSLDKALEGLADA